MEVPSALIKRYLNRRKAEIDDCLLALEKKDYESLLRVGHQLKGNGTTFGFPDLSMLGQKLETATLSSDIQEMHLTLTEISAWINHRLSSGSFP